MINEKAPSIGIGDDLAGIGLACPTADKASHQHGRIDGIAPVCAKIERRVIRRLEGGNSPLVEYPRFAAHKIFAIPDMRVFLGIPVLVELHVAVQDFWKPLVVAPMDREHDRAGRACGGVAEYRIDRVMRIAGVVTPPDFGALPTDGRHKRVDRDLADSRRFFDPNQSVAFKRLDGAVFALQPHKAEDRAVRAADFLLGHGEEATATGSQSQTIDDILEQLLRAIADRVLELAGAQDPLLVEPCTLDQLVSDRPRLAATAPAV
nr:hypothetical protein [Sphingomonas sp. SRS2]